MYYFKLAIASFVIAQLWLLPVFGRFCLGCEQLYGVVVRFSLPIVSFLLIHVAGFIAPCQDFMAGRSGSELSLAEFLTLFMCRGTHGLQLP